MTFKNKTKLVAFTAACSFLLIAFTAEGLAENRWIQLYSKSGAFAVKMPNDYETTMEGIRISPTAVANSEKLVATVDQRPFKDVIKTFTMETEQTFGVPFSAKEVTNIMANDMDRFRKFYEDAGAKIKQTSRKNGYGGIVNELFVSYLDPKLGPQSVRIALFTSDYTKYLQTFSGPDNAVFDLKVNSYFKEVEMSWGVSKQDGNLKAEWNKYLSPHNIFTAYFPPPTKKYGDEPPKIHHNEFNEWMSYAFKDPARNQKLFYKITAYKTDRALKPVHLKKILMKRHVLNYKRKMDKVGFIAKEKGNGVVAIGADMNIEPPKEIPYANLVRLYGEASGKYMIVHEIIGSSKLVKADFIDYLIEATEFHPEKAELIDIINKNKQSKADRTETKQDSLDDDELDKDKL